MWKPTAANVNILPSEEIEMAAGKYDLYYGFKAETYLVYVTASNRTAQCMDGYFTPSYAFQISDRTSESQYCERINV